MPVLNKKERMISFRISDAEYEQAERQCELNGMRSVSALAHFAFLGALKNESGDEGFGLRRVARLEEQMKDALARVGELERQLKRERLE